MCMERERERERERRGCTKEGRKEDHEGTGPGGMTTFFTHSLILPCSSSLPSFPPSSSLPMEGREIGGSRVTKEGEGRGR